MKPYHCAAFALAASLCAWEVRAAGGAHVVDDAEVETPGLCHLENWASRLGDRRSLINIAPACTSLGLPSVEIGGAIQHLRTRATGKNGAGQTLLGPSMKIVLVPLQAGAGVALAMSALADPDGGRGSSATLFLPISLDLAESLRLNLNAGYAWASTGDRHAATAGMQIDTRLSRSLSLMAELFARDAGEAGVQAGLRWALHESLDLDLLGGRRVDGSRGLAFTIGLTIRR